MCRNNPGQISKDSAENGQEKKTDTDGESKSGKEEEVEVRKGEQKEGKEQENEVEKGDCVKRGSKGNK